ncbi:hypothetical protein PM082_020819 [Marasmius tenuissimus]|nr:hypothetical protein PM082_020819 [Marasmius tenuissimus]
MHPLIFPSLTTSSYSACIQHVLSYTYPAQIYPLSFAFLTLIKSITSKFFPTVLTSSNVVYFADIITGCQSLLGGSGATVLSVPIRGVAYFVEMDSEAEMLPTNWLGGGSSSKCPGSIANWWVEPWFLRQFSNWVEPVQTGLWPIILESILPLLNVILVVVIDWEGCLTSYFAGLDARQALWLMFFMSSQMCHQWAKTSKNQQKQVEPSPLGGNTMSREFRIGFSGHLDRADMTQPRQKSEWKRQKPTCRNGLAGVGERFQQLEAKWMVGQILEAIQVAKYLAYICIDLWDLQRGSGNCRTRGESRARENVCKVWNLRQRCLLLKSSFGALFL